MELEIIEVIMLWMKGEINSFLKVWLTALSSLSFCYFSSKILRKGISRFLVTIPLVCLNLILPLHLHTMHLGGSTAFFLSWLANFKLLMFTFGKGPLSHDPPLSLGSFLAIASLPIKIKHKENPLQKSNQNDEERSEGDRNRVSTKGLKLKPCWSYGIKILLIPLFLRIYGYSEYIHPWLIMAIYCVHIYVGLELILAIVGELARFFLGVELEPQFNEPYLSTSLQDFWGRRWNIMVNRILHPSVYEPVLRISTRVIDRKWAPLPAIFSTFIVSAIMHELIFYYLGRRWPSWEISCFFLLHGVCLMIEVAIKKFLNGRINIPRIIAAPLTVGFVMVTGFWLFFPEFLRCDSMERAFQEYSAINAFMKDVVGALKF